MSEEHVHAWRATVHLDGCHSYTNAYRCSCGAERVISGERQMRKRGKAYPSMMANPEECERCSDLMTGKARRKPRRDVVYLPEQSPSTSPRS